MIRLDATTRKLQVILAGAKATNDNPVVASWSDAASSAYTGGTTVVNTNGTTVVDIVGAPAASTIRDVDNISLKNEDTSPITATVRYNDNTTIYNLTAVTLQVGDTLMYTHAQGWHVLDSNGCLKSGTGPSGTGLGVCNFRLTLTSGTPVTTGDVTGATTVYCTPLRGNQIDLYTGSVWVRRSTAEFSLGLGTLTSGKPYDVFCYDNSGTPTLEFLAWTDGSNRATALTTQDGILVKSGAATRRYLGTFYTTSTTTTEDSLANRLLYNYYNQIEKPMYCEEDTSSWNYTLATLRQVNANSAYKLQVVQGVAERPVDVSVACMVYNNSGAGGADMTLGIGIDSTTSDSANTDGGTAIQLASRLRLRAAYRGVLSAGYHYIAPLEHSDAVGTTTWYGTQVGVGRKHRISGFVYV